MKLTFHKITEIEDRNKAGPKLQGDAARLIKEDRLRAADAEEMRYRQHRSGVISALERGAL
jgi:hypothetical protein